MRRRLVPWRKAGSGILRSLRCSLPDMNPDRPRRRTPCGVRDPEADPPRRGTSQPRGVEGRPSTLPLERAIAVQVPRVRQHVAVLIPPLPLKPELGALLYIVGRTRVRLSGYRDGASCRRQQAQGDIEGHHECISPMLEDGQGCVTTKTRDDPRFGVAAIPWPFAWPPYHTRA